MDLLYVMQFLKTVLKELWHLKFAVLATGACAAFAVLGYGFLWQEKYEVTTKLYADRQNIISPLLAGQAQVTKIENRKQVVRDLMLSPRIVEKIVIEEGFLSGGESAAELASKVSSVTSRVNVKMLGESYISVNFADTNPERAYSVVTRLVDFFIRESSANKKSQSKQAFLFIDRQAESYKEQLRQAEESLKTFKANNLDGTEARVTGRIDGLRVGISDIELELEQITAEIQSLETQVRKENRYLSRKAKADMQGDRIREAQNQLDNMRLSLTDNHPDVIALIQHIDGLRDSINDIDDSEVIPSGQGVENPLYDKLREQLSTAQVTKSTTTKKLSALKRRLTEEHDRAKRIAARNAELQELTRDYDVTKGLYEDLLNRKEKARLSMTLDIEGQGVTYKIQEPAQFPLSPSGLSFIDFVFIGCVIGIAVPLALAVALVLLDPRMRFPALLDESYGLPVLGVVPHFVSLPEKRVRKREIKWVLFLIVLIGGVYFSIAAGLMILDFV